MLTISFLFHFNPPALRCTRHATSTSRIFRVSARKHENINRHGVTAQRRSPSPGADARGARPHLIANTTMEGGTLRRQSNAAYSRGPRTSVTPITDHFEVRALRSRRWCGAWPRCGSGPGTRCCCCGSGSRWCRCYRRSGCWRWSGSAATARQGINIRSATARPD